MELGKPFLDSVVIDGIFKVKDREIVFSDETGNLQPLKMNLLTSTNTCSNPEPCMLEIFVMQ